MLFQRDAVRIETIFGLGEGEVLVSVHCKIAASYTAFPASGR